jgi:hypothetical protein
MRSLITSILALSFVTVVAVACDGSRGDSCDEEGKVGGECDDGLVCAKSHADNSGDLVCVSQCNTDADCRSGEGCYAVKSTSIKGCKSR